MLRHPLNNSENDHKKESVKEEDTPIVSVSTSVKIQLGLSVLIRLINWTSAILGAASEESNISKVSAISLSMFVLGAVIQLFKYHSDFKRKLLPDTEPKTVTLNTRGMISWQTGEMQLYNHVNIIIPIMNELKKASLSNIEPPQQFQMLNKIWPYHTIIWDMASKARHFELLFPYSFLPSKYLTSLSPLLSSLGNVFHFGYAAVVFASALRESYLLRDIELRLNLEGFSYNYRDYMDFPPTCIGRQMTRSIVFRPTNSNLQDIVSYINKAEEVIKYASEKLSFPKDSSLANKLKQFKYITFPNAQENPIEDKLQQENKSPPEQSWLSSYSIFKKPFFFGAVAGGLLTGGLGFGLSAAVAAAGAGASVGAAASALVDNCRSHLRRS